MLLVACLVLWSGLAMATGEQDFTADAGLRLYTVGNSGFHEYFVATDGTATIKWMWLKKDGTANAGDVVRAEPDGAVGNSVYALRTIYPPRKFPFATPPDSVYVDVTTANEVILSW